MKRIIATLLIIAVFGLFLSCDNGGGGGKILILLGATHHSANEGTSVLYVINMTDGTATEIGDIGYGINGLAFDVANSKLYATTTNKDSSFPDGLIEIDMVTGAGTRIGTGAGMQVLNPTINSSGTMFA